MSKAEVEVLDSNYDEIINQRAIPAPEAVDDDVLESAEVESESNVTDTENDVELEADTQDHNDHKDPE